MEWLLILLVNFVVGACIGICGIAGFVLPMFYISLGMSTVESLALSFSAFILSGVIGSAEYWKSRNLDLKFGTRLGIGSLVGALAGVRLNLILPEESVKLLLYAVVLLSGISILMRRDRESGNGFRIQEHGVLTLLFGGITGAVCSASGAGGPVLVMPLLVTLGIPVRMAVGIALYDSIFIGVPSAAGYFSQCVSQALLVTLLLSLAAHGAGVFLGSKIAVYINQTFLKRAVAIGSIALACFKLVTM